MCRCVRVGGCGCMLGGRPWAASAGPPAAEIFPPFQILYPRSYTPDLFQILYPDLLRYFVVESFICLKSIIGRFQTDKWAAGGDLKENGCFIEGKRVLRWTAGPFICLKSMIGRFQTDEWSLWGRSSWKWLFYWRKTRCALIFSIYIKKHAEIEFYLHKDFCAAGIEFYLHKDFRAAEIEFYLHKEFLRKINEYIWKFSALRAPIC